MTKRHLAAALGFGLLFTASLPAAAATLHVIVVGDTQDPNIGVGVETDTKKFSREMERVAEATGLNLSDVIVKDSNFNIQNLARTIRGIRVAPDDVIMFLYSGHGFRTPGKDTKWPFLALRDPVSGEHAPADFAEVVDLLGERKPRLMIALVDACNNSAAATGARNDREQGVPLRQLTSDLKAGYQRLFLDGKGFLIAAAASPNEVANGEVTGGVLTNEFLRALADEVRRSSPSWKSIATAATVPLSRTSPSGRTERQTPFYRIDMAEAVPSRNVFPGFSDGANRTSTGSSSAPTSAPPRSPSPASRSGDGGTSLFK